MRCKDVRILINKYLDGTLNEANSEALFAHIHSCAHCKKELKQLTELKSVLKNLPDEEPPKGLLSGALEKAKSISPEHKVRYFPRRTIAGIAAAIVITIGAVWYFNANVLRSPGAADMAAPKAQMMTAMEAPAQTPATLMQAVPQVESGAPSASMAASSAASAARNESSEAASLNSASADSAGMDKARAIEITIEAAKAKDFYTDLMALIKKNNIAYSETKTDDANTVSFALEQTYTSEIEGLFKKYNIEQALQTPSAMDFVFKRS